MDVSTDIGTDANGKRVWIFIRYPRPVTIYLDIDTDIRADFIVKSSVLWIIRSRLISNQGLIRGSVECYIQVPYLGSEHKLLLFMIPISDYSLIKL